MDFNFEETVSEVYSNSLFFEHKFPTNIPTNQPTNHMTGGRFRGVEQILLLFIVMISGDFNCLRRILPLAHWWSILIICHHFIFLCIYYKLKKSNTSYHASNLENIFNDDELFQMFKEYSKSEWSVENIFCKVDINNYKSLNSPNKRKILSEFI
jgi:hypothetical protein